MPDELAQVPGDWLLAVDEVEVGFVDAEVDFSNAIIGIRHQLKPYAFQGNGPA